MVTFTPGLSEYHSIEKVIWFWVGQRTSVTAFYRCYCTETDANVHTLLLPQLKEHYLVQVEVY